MFSAVRAGAPAGSQGHQPVNSIVAACMLLAVGFPGGAVLQDSLPAVVYLGPGSNFPVPLDPEGQETWWIEMDWFEMED